MPPVEQNKLKRSGIGLRACDHERAFPGFTLFAPQSGGGKVYLIDLDGNVVHTWQMPYPPGNYGYLTERGTYFYNGQIYRGLESASSADNPGKAAWPSKRIGTAASFGKCANPDHHHDGIRLRNGNVLLICLAQLPQHLVSRVKGGRAGTEHNGVDVRGLPRRDDDRRTQPFGNGVPGSTSIRRPIASRQRKMQREDWTHANGLAELPNGDIVVSFRNISTVIIIDRKTGNVIWKLGAPAAIRPACADAAPKWQPACSSTTARTGWIIRCPFRVSSKLNWRPSRSFGSTKSKREYEFFSPRISNAQRLPNGNTLICEGGLRPPLRGHKRQANWFGNTSIPISAKGPTEQTIASFAPTDIAPRRSRGRKRLEARNEKHYCHRPSTLLILAPSLSRASRRDAKNAK